MYRSVLRRLNGASNFRRERLEQRKIMSYSANIVRNIVASVFQVPARKVKISGKIDPKFVPQENCGHSWADMDEMYHSVWGWTPKGFVRIAGPYWGERVGDDFPQAVQTLKREFYYSDNGQEEWREGDQIGDLVTPYPFYVVREVNRPNGDRLAETISFTVYGG